MRCNAEFYYVGKIPRYTYWYLQVAAATRGFKMVLFTASRGNTFVGGKCALPSALLVSYFDFIFTTAYNKILFCCLWRNVDASCHKHVVFRLP